MNKIYLMGVLVSDGQGKNKTVTNRDGGYQLSLPQGEHTIRFSYLGYDPLSRKVTIVPGETTRLDVDFSEAAMGMEEVVITGQAVGTAKALNQQKTAPNLKNIVASDAMGRFPDQNAAEALDRMPGISIERDQGEGRFVIVRGIDPHLNTASIDGVNLAAAEAENRAVLLDVLPMNVMETVEVTKALTADMPADSIGGHINIVTPSAFDRSQRTLQGSVSGNYCDLTDELGESGQFTIGDVLGKDKTFGVLASVSYDKRELGSDNVEADPWELNDDGEWTTEELQYREYNLTRERFSALTNLEFKPSEENQYFLRGLYSSFTDHEYRHRAVVKDMLMLPDSSTGGTIVGEDYEDDSSALAKTEIQLKDREETQSNWAVSMGGKHRIDSLTVDYKVGYSYAEQDTPDDTQFFYERSDLGYAYSSADGDTPAVTNTSGNGDDLTEYGLDSVEQSTQLVKEKDTCVAANLKKDLDTPYPSYIKTGFSLDLRNKTNDQETIVYEDAPGGFDTLDGHTQSGRQAYSAFALASENLADQFNRVKDQFSSQRDIEESEAEDYETDEDVYAFYVMGEVDFGKYTLLPGIRMEHTRLNASGNIFYEDTETVEGQEKENEYTNILPSLHAKYRFSEDLILYAAWTNTLSRPQWDQTRYGKFVGDDGDVEIGNPDLDPYEAMNYDLTLSYYMPASLGMASISVFYKDIKNFIYSQTSDLGSYEQTTYKNGDAGKIYGIELASIWHLNFLPAPLDGFSIEGNLTLSDSEADVMAPEAGESGRTVDFVRNSDMVGSIALSYEKAGFFIRLSGSYRSSYLDELGDETIEDRYIDDHFQLDLSTSYTFFDKYTLFANIINLNNEPLRAYYGESGRLSQYEEYGWSARFGLKFNF
jgi:TonB-dependent receptor